MYLICKICLCKARVHNLLCIAVIAMTPICFALAIFDIRLQILEPLLIDIILPQFVSRSACIGSIVFCTAGSDGDLVVTPLRETFQFKELWSRIHIIGNK